VFLLSKTRYLHFNGFSQKPCEGCGISKCTFIITTSVFIFMSAWLVGYIGINCIPLVSQWGFCIHHHINILDGDVYV